MSAHTSTSRPLFAKTAVIGPGGWRCPCCAPLTNKNGARKMLRRQGKKRERAMAQREENALLLAEAAEIAECVRIMQLQRLYVEDDDRPDPDEDERNYSDLSYDRWPYNETWDYAQQREYSRSVSTPTDKLYDTWVRGYRVTVQWMYDRWAVWLDEDKAILPLTMTLPQVQQYAELLIRLEKAAAPDEDLPF